MITWEWNWGFELNNVARNCLCTLVCLLPSICMKMEINVNGNCAGVESEYILNGNIGMLRKRKSQN